MAKAKKEKESWKVCDINEKKGDSQTKSVSCNTDKINKKTFAFVGGDRRLWYTAKAICDIGHRVRCFGIGTESKDLDSGSEVKDYHRDKNIVFSDSLSECIKGADVIVLPVPYTIDGENINMPYASYIIPINEVCDLADEKSVIFAGKTDSELEKLCRDKKIMLCDYSREVEFEVLNAVPTAEGAIKFAMENTDYTLWNSKCLVVGYGRIGKVLVSRLKAFGAEVTATARKNRDIAWIRSAGADTEKTENIGDVIEKYDIVFNTVPYCVLDSKVLSRVKKDALIIDLASRPGGVDFEYAKKRHLNVIWALSLPGKESPKTAGEIILTVIFNMLEEI